MYILNFLINGLAKLKRINLLNYLRKIWIFLNYISLFTKRCEFIVRVNWISRKQQPHVKRTGFEYSWKSHVTKSYIKEFDDLREHLPVSGGPRSIFLGPLEIDQSHGRRMMRLDGTRRETGATDHRVEERAHLGRFSLSLSFLSIFNHPYLLSVSVSVSLLFLRSTHRRCRSRSPPLWVKTTTMMTGPPLLLGC